MRVILCQFHYTSCFFSSLVKWLWQVKAVYKKHRHFMGTTIEMFLKHFHYVVSFCKLCYTLSHSYFSLFWTVWEMSYNYTCMRPKMFSEYFFEHSYSCNGTCLFAPCFTVQNNRQKFDMFGLRFNCFTHASDVAHVSFLSLVKSRNIHKSQLLSCCD